MDEIVFTREQLRRALLAVIELLANAAERYDAEHDFPAEDFLAGMSATYAIQPPLVAYSTAIADRVKQRTGAS